uniref:BHLH domain-containing protein n=1 Tax=Otus sunia TaxID=257818 RepID=A0A8C8BLA0_9STRI
MARPPAPLLPWGLINATSPQASAEPPDMTLCPPRGQGQRGGPGGDPGRCRGVGDPRQSASEQEKLRMRRLAQALLRLRHYLPPALAPTGQSLTKIETLRLAIRYIRHLSALLGLSEEALARRRGAAPRHCPLCPQGLGCCQSPDPRRHPPALQEASPPGTGGWGSPPVVGTPSELVAWRSLPSGPAAGTPPEVLGVPDTGMETWGEPPYTPVTGTPPELHGAVVSSASSWLCCAPPQPDSLLWDPPRCTPARAGFPPTHTHTPTPHPGATSGLAGGTVGPTIQGGFPSPMDPWKGSLPPHTGSHPAGTLSLCPFGDLGDSPQGKSQL